MNTIRILQNIFCSFNKIIVSFQSLLKNTTIDISISKYSSFIYIVNSILGAGLVGIPSVVINSGVLASASLNIITAIFSSICTLMLIKSMSIIVSIGNFDGRLEYVRIMKFFLTKFVGIFAEFSFHITLQTLNLLSIIVTSEVLDRFITLIFKRTLVFELFPEVGFKLLNNELLDLIYRGDGTNIVFSITIGYVINLLICTPMCLLNLEENMLIQYISFYITMFAVAQILFKSVCQIIATNEIDKKLLLGISETVVLPKKPSFRGLKYDKLFSTFIVAYSYIVLTPSLINEVQPNVKLERVIWSSNFFCAILYSFFGYILAFAYPNSNNSNDIFEVILSKPSTTALTKLCINILDFFTIAPGIMVNCIATRHNLVNEKHCNKKWARFWGVFIPFSISWIFSSDCYFSRILIWCTMLFSFISNYILPIITYIIASKFSQNPAKLAEIKIFTGNLNKKAQIGDFSGNKYNFFDYTEFMLKISEIFKKNTLKNEVLNKSLLEISNSEISNEILNCPSCYEGELWDPYATRRDFSSTGNEQIIEKVSFDEKVGDFSNHLSFSNCNYSRKENIHISVFPEFFEKYDLQIAYFMLFFLTILGLYSIIINIKKYQTELYVETNIKLALNHT